MTEEEKKMCEIIVNDREYKEIMKEMKENNYSTDNILKLFDEIDDESDKFGGFSCYDIACAIMYFATLLEKLQKEITNDIERENSLKDDLMEIIETLKLENNVVCQETILQEIVRLQEENEELKEKVFKRDKKLIRLEEYANKNFERKDDVKANYIPKDKIREKIRYLGDEGYYEFNTKRDLEKAIEMFKELLEEE